LQEPLVQRPAAVAGAARSIVASLAMESGVRTRPGEALAASPARGEASSTLTTRQVTAIRATTSPASATFFTARPPASVTASGAAAAGTLPRGHASASSAGIQAPRPPAVASIRCRSSASARARRVFTVFTGTSSRCAIAWGGSPSW
jgi:hypothetical protein